MTDSDFFTESDADDFRHTDQRDQRRAQVMIDGHLYGPLNQSSNANVFNQPEDSCMESSGIFSTDEAAASSKKFDEPKQHECGENQSTTNDISSPDDTVSSSNTAYSQNKLQNAQNRGEFENIYLLLLYHFIF